MQKTSMFTSPAALLADAIFIRTQLQLVGVQQQRPVSRGRFLRARQQRAQQSEDGANPAIASDG